MSRRRPHLPDRSAGDEPSPRSDAATARTPYTALLHLVDGRHADAALTPGHQIRWSRNKIHDTTAMLIQQLASRRGQLAITQLPRGSRVGWGGAVTIDRYHPALWGKTGGSYAR